jgi:HlyD family secretion protein/adhesin transport system membrane fusion protein
MRHASSSNLLQEVHAYPLLQEPTPPKQSRINIFIIAGVLTTFIVWASLTIIDEITVGTGKVVPVDLVKSIQHLDGGTISKILVQEGQMVEKGDVLLHLDGVTARSELSQMKVRKRALEIQSERLRSFGLDIKPDFSRFGEARDPLVKEQSAIYEMQLRNKEDQINIFNKQLEQAKNQLASKQKQQSDIKEQFDVIEQRRDADKQLFDRRLKTRTDYLRAEQDLKEIQTEHNLITNQVLETQNKISEAEGRLLELNTRLRNEALIQLNDITSELAQIEERLSDLNDRVKRLDIYAPISGLIKGLRVTATGMVMKPGDEILQIVPIHDLEIEAQVTPDNIGNVEVGQKALIKVSAYDYAQYGGLEGVVKTISASTYMNDENKPIYKVIINQLNKKYLGHNANKNQITPGMTAQVNIDTGNKSLLNYLIRPVYNAVSEAFQEK